MDFTIDHLPDVEQDVQDIYDWYEEQHTGLGEDFLLSSDAALNSIERNPLAYQIVYKGVRKTNTRRFPFGVFYVVAKQQITIIAIIHQSRHPRTWKKRISKMR
jgi:toxin ParE1/3/4